MKNRYVPLAFDEWFPDDIRRMDVLVEDKTPVKTGLLDINGVPLYRIEETVPFGFRGKLNA